MRSKFHTVSLCSTTIDAEQWFLPKAIHFSQAALHVNACLMQRYKQRIYQPDKIIVLSITGASSNEAYLLVKTNGTITTTFLYSIQDFPTLVTSNIPQHVSRQYATQQPHSFLIPISFQCIKVCLHSKTNPDDTFLTAYQMWITIFSQPMNLECKHTSLIVTGETSPHYDVAQQVCNIKKEHLAFEASCDHRYFRLPNSMMWPLY